MKSDVIFGVVRSMGWEITVKEFESHLSNVALIASTDKRTIRVNAAADFEDQIYGVCGYALGKLTTEKKPIWFNGDYNTHAQSCLTGWDYSQIQGFVVGVYKALAMVSSWTNAR